MSRATIHHLAVAREPPDAPVEAVVARLEGLLAEARSGQLRGLAAVTLAADGTITYGHDHDGGDAAWARLLSGAVCLQSLMVEGALKP